MRKFLSILLGILLVASPCFAAVFLNGDADYIDIGFDSEYGEIATNNELTIFAWVYPTDLTVDATVLGRFQVSTDSEKQFLLWMDTDGGADGWAGVVTYDVSGIGVSVGTTTASATVNTWQAVTLSWDGTNLRIWVDGVNVATTANAQSIRSVSTKISIGSFSTDEPGRYGKGNYSEIYLWSKALTQNQIEQLSFSKVKRIGLQIEPNNLIFYHPLDSFSDSTALDTNANGYKDLSENKLDGQGVDGDGDSLNLAETVLSYQ